MAPVKYKCPKATSTGCDWEVEHDPRVVSVYIQSHLDDVHLDVTDEDLDQATCKMAPRKYKCLKDGCEFGEDLAQIEMFCPEEVYICAKDHTFRHGPEHVVAVPNEVREFQPLVENEAHQACKMARKEVRCQYQDCNGKLEDKESEPDMNMASVPSKVQEIELMKEDDNRQACKTALMKVECHHFGCEWKLEDYEAGNWKLEECPDVVQIWIQDHMDTEHGEFLEIELLEEDKNRQACKTALAKVKCQHQGCDWEEELYPEVADIWIQDHVDTVHGGSQYIGPALCAPG